MGRARALWRFAGAVGCVVGLVACGSSGGGGGAPGSSAVDAGSSPNGGSSGGSGAGTGKDASAGGGYDSGATGGGTGDAGGAATGDAGRGDATASGASSDAGRGDGGGTSASVDAGRADGGTTGAVTDAGRGDASGGGNAVPDASAGGSGAGFADSGIGPMIPDTDAGLDSWFDGGAPALTANVTLHIAGDSTSCIFPPTDPTMRIGWGQVLPQLVGAGLTVDDEAKSGRSSKSFIDEGWWAMLQATIKPGDYVFIEFGHNDEKSGDPTLFTDPATTFRDYLNQYVVETRAARGFPVLLTPIARRDFSGNTVVNSHGDYPAAVFDVGAFTHTPVIDMTAKTTAWLDGLGPTASVPFFAVGDNTHLNAMGAPVVAGFVVDGIRELGLPIEARLQ